jgi:2-methylisocitrate lyase-like PEP mutase family enzyme
VGCNLEDSDHRRRGALVDADVVAGRLRAVRAAADRAGVPLVVNARIDTFLHGGGDPGTGPASGAGPASARAPGSGPGPGTAAGEALLAETVRRARLYLAAGADCVYPIRLVAPSTVSRLVEALDAPVNANLGPGTTVADLAAAGASRVSFGPSLQGQLMAELGRRAAALMGLPDQPSTP